MTLKPDGFGSLTYTEYNISVAWADNDTGHVFDNVLAAGEPCDTFTVTATEEEPTFEDFKTAFHEWVKRNKEWLAKRQSPVEGGEA